MLSNPATARKGNLLAAAGMVVAILGTIFLYQDEEGQKLGNYSLDFWGIPSEQSWELLLPKSKNDGNATNGETFSTEWEELVLL